MDINSICSNKNNIYYGHGTGPNGDMIIDSIMQNGLRCSHQSLYYTSINFGFGGTISESVMEQLDNWPHKDSKIIAIVSLPFDYIVIDSIGLGTYLKSSAAYYYIPSEKQCENNFLTPSPYVMPEFVLGYYDARNKQMVTNPKHYEFLSEEKKKDLFERIKENYFNVLEDGCGVEKYKSLIESNSEIQYKFPLSEEDIIKFRNKRIGETNSYTTSKSMR